MDIGLGFDDQYSMHAQALIESILDQEGDPNTDDLRFWLASPQGLPGASQERILRQIADRAEVSFLPPSVDVMSLPLSSSEFAAHISHAMYMRLTLPASLPSKVTRYVYLDCDMLCTSSINELAHVDLEGHVAGAVRDIYTRRFSDQGYLPGLLEHPELNAGSNYFNSGMLVVDVPRWVADNVTERAYDYIRDHETDARFPDQDALNFVLEGGWKRLPRKWNHMMSWRLEPEVGGSLDDAALIHCPGPSKFWSASFPQGSERSRRYWSYRAKADHDSSATAAQGVR